MQTSLEMTQFGKLFKKYRLHSEIESLAEFGDLLAEEGFVYETSLFTRWQKSERIPKDRKVLLAILRVFVKRRGIQTIQQANTFIESANQRSLTLDESTALLEYMQPALHTSLPAKPALFIERDQIVEKVVWQLINKGSVYFYGMPGVGKTYMALYIAHSLKNVFSDGVFWFRADVKRTQSVIDELLLGLGMNPQEFGTIEQKIERLTEILDDRKVLVILDNLNEISLETVLMLSKLPLKMVITSIVKLDIPSMMYLKVKPFTYDEFQVLGQEILGKPFFETNKKALDKIGNSIGFLPISSVISLKRIYANPVNLSKYVSVIQKHSLNLHDVSYDNKNLYAAIDMSFQNLDKSAQEALVATALFDGSDFDPFFLSKYLGQTSPQTLKNLNSFVDLSLLERSSGKRFRLHPMIKKFANIHSKTDQYVKLAQLYIKYVQKFEPGSKEYLEYFTNEFENIIGVIKFLYKSNEYSLVTELWKMVTLYVFVSGNWSIMKEFDKAIRDSYIKIGDERGMAIYLIEDIGRIYFFQNNEKKLMEIINFVQKIADSKKDQYLSALIIQKIGAINMFSNNLDQAERCLLESIIYLSRLGTSTQLAKSYAYLGMVYAKMEMHHKAIKTLRSTLKMSKLLDDKSVFGFIYSYLGHSFLRLGDSHNAEKFFRLGLKATKKYHVVIGEAMCQEGMYEVLSKIKGKAELALDYSKAANKRYAMLGIGVQKRFSIIHRT